MEHESENAQYEKTTLSHGRLITDSSLADALPIPNSSLIHCSHKHSQHQHEFIWSQVYHYETGDRL